MTDDELKRLTPWQRWKLRNLWWIANTQVEVKVIPMPDKWDRPKGRDDDR